ncbi:MAG: hypothetical protein PHS93_00990 [Candidatus Omnitrophica bacterium]|nr:hypothetical protein [Candidatus Omnitrophota bacterium]MDD5351729.1 hypothetical protein [Candidatus Omnitrophota bacterium]MDD5550939.1 hypothetical protein [Candidatus Omnitrophota bacterium]
MGYDRKLLESWISMEDWGDHVVKNGGLASKEGFDFLSKEYFLEVKRKIGYCNKLLKSHEDAFLNFVIATLYDKYDLDKSPAYLYKRSVKYYCLRALEIDPDFTPAKELLQKVETWLNFIGGDKNQHYISGIDFFSGD